MKLRRQPRTRNAQHKEIHSGLPYGTPLNQILAEKPPEEPELKQTFKAVHD
jgi:hypothetical protein